MIGVPSRRKRSYVFKVDNRPPFQGAWLEVHVPGLPQPGEPSVNWVGAHKVRVTPGCPRVPSRASAPTGPDPWDKANALDPGSEFQFSGPLAVAWLAAAPLAMVAGKSCRKYKTTLGDATHDHQR